MPRTKAEILKYLADTRSHYAAYHNHKEVSAWAGVVLYVVFAVQVAFARDEMFKSKPIVYAACLLSVVFFLIILAYLKTQFRLRRDAANYVAALLYLGVEYLGKDDATLKKEEKDEDMRWILEAKHDVGHHSEQVLPKLVLTKALEMDDVGHGDRKKLEAAAYGIVVLSFVADALRLWFVLV